MNYSRHHCDFCGERLYSFAEYKTGECDWCYEDSLYWYDDWW